MSYYYQDLRTYLTIQVSAICPSNGVSISDWSNTASWTFVPQASANSSQITAAQSYLNTFDMVSYQAMIDANTARILTSTNDSNVIDLRSRLVSANSSQIDTWLTNNVTTLAQARTVLGAIVKYFITEDFS